MKAFYLFSVCLHILAAATWLGGMLFFVIVLMPITRRAEYSGIAAELMQWLGIRFRWLGWICFGLLVLTGTLNLLYRGIAWATLEDARLWHGALGRILGVKLLLVAIILLASAYHDFFVGPRAAAVWQATPASPTARRLRLQARWLGRINLPLALIVVAFAVMLVRGGP